MVCVVSGPAVPAAPIIGAVAGLVSRVLAMALEAVNVGWECSLALPKGATRWSPWILYHSPFKTILSFAVLWIRIRRSLRCVNARDNAARGGLGTSAKKMRDQARPNRCMSQVALHFVLFLFSFELLSPQLCPLLPDGGEAKVLLPQSVDICDDPCISQMQECVIYDSAVNRRGVKKG